MTRVKICGLTRAADVRAAVAAGADAVGVVCDLPVDSPREVPTGRATELLAAVPPFVTGVVVTMPASADDAAELVRRVGADAVQVHGDLDADSIGTLADRTDAAVLRSVAADDPGTARAVDGVADAVVLDSLREDGAGGTGRTHDWKRAGALAADLAVPVVLAGGLTPGTVDDAIAAAGPFAVDVASGVEAAPGEKDHDAVARFVANARRAPAPA